VVYLAAALTLGGGNVWSLPGRDVLYRSARSGPRGVGRRVVALVNPIFLHGGLLHVGMNMLALASLGRWWSTWSGEALSCGVRPDRDRSFAASTLLSPRSLSIGASGASSA